MKDEISKSKDTNEDTLEKVVEERMEEREELYDVFEKEKWYFKIFKRIGIIEDANEVKTNKEKIYEAGYEKGALKGFINASLIFIIGIVLYWVLKHGIFSTQLKNIEEIKYKLNEINYYIDKFYLYDKDEDKIADYVAMGMMASLDDKYAAYYTKEDLVKLQEEVEGEYYGIGVVVIQDVTDGYLVVSKIYDESDAKNTSLSIGDKIIKVDDEDVYGYSSDEVVALVRGEEGTKVKLTVLKSDKTTTEEIEILRKKIEQEIVTGKIINNNIGYISIDQFEGKAYEQFIKYKEEFINQNIKGLIIDLRNNPGGNLEVLKNLSDIFLDNKLITYFKFNDDKIINYYTNEGSWNIPIVILVNEYSASASEAFTGALKDNGVATIVGTQTYGKGIVQEIYKLHDGSAIKFTTADYYTPSGINITGEGITPDVVVEYEYDDNQLDSAIKVLNDKIN